MEVDSGSGHGVADGPVLVFGGGQQSPAELGIARIDDELLAGLGVLYDQEPGVGQLVLARIDQTDGDDLVAFGEAHQRPIPPRLADEVGDQHDERPAAHQSGGVVEQLVEIGHGAAAERAQQLAHQREDLVAALPGRNRPLTVAVVDDRADPVAAPHEQLADRGGQLAEDLLLGSLHGAERHGARTVEQEPSRELAVLHELPYEQLVHAGGDVPVDVADVVTPLVVAQVAEVGAVAAQQRAVVALQAAVESPDDLPLEAAQDPFGRQAGGGFHSRSLSANVLVPRITTSGTGILERMASTMCSAVTSSASAS